MNQASGSKQFTKFLKRNSFELMLIAWVKCGKCNSFLSDEKLIDQFYKYWDISETELISKDAARQVIYRIEKEYNDMNKGDEEKK